LCIDGRKACKKEKTEEDSYRFHCVLLSLSEVVLLQTRMQGYIKINVAL
jgi:hypothetical protein